MQEKSSLPRYLEYLVLIFALSGLLMSLVNHEAVPLGLCVALIAVCVVMISEWLQKRLDHLAQQVEAKSSNAKS